MERENLEKANALLKEIKELEEFIQRAEKGWTGTIIKRKARFIFKANPYGILSAAEFNMNTTIKNRVLDVLRNYLAELKQQLAEI